MKKILVLLMLCSHCLLFANNYIWSNEIWNSEIQEVESKESLPLYSESAIFTDEAWLSSSTRPDNGNTGDDGLGDLEKPEAPVPVGNGLFIMLFMIFAYLLGKIKYKKNEN